MIRQRVWSMGWLRIPQIQQRLRGVLPLAVALGVWSCSDTTTVVPGHAGAVSRPTISISLSDSTAVVGDLVAVSIDAQLPQLDSMSAIAAFRARLAFASGALQYVDENVADVGVHAIKADGDTVRIAGVSPSPGFVDGRLVTLHFRVLDPTGLHSLRVVLDELKDLRYNDRRAEFAGRGGLILGRRADVVPPPSGSRVYGDATADGVIDASDALAILTKDVGLPTPAGFDSVAADVNADNLVNALDAQILLASFVGRDVIQFRLGDLVGSVRVSITAVSPDTLRPGVAVTITGSNFNSAAANDTVMIDSIPLAITTVTSTQIMATVPTTIPCRATHGALVTVHTGGSTGSYRQMLRVATLRSMKVSDTLVFDSDSAFRCNEFPAGVYFAAVYNSAREASAVPASFQLISTSGTNVDGTSALANRIAPGVLKNLVPPRPSGSFQWNSIPNGDLIRRHTLSHLQFMARDLQRAKQARFGPSRQVSPANGGQLRRSLNIAPTIGAYSTLSFLGTTKAGNDTTITIRARTVYVGSRSIILEDSLAPLATQMDSYYQQLGTEFDNVMYPILLNNFGNPLAMDANLNGVGRITMLFTPAVTQYYPDVEAFVTSCDFLTPADCPATNQTEMFYSTVPTRLTTTDGSNPAYDESTPQGWYNEIRGTLIHESKHITALAEKFSRSTNPVLEESWLEEGTAQIASELYARTISDATWKGGTGFTSAIRCEIYLCPGYTFTMTDHFAWLHDYEIADDSLSPINPGSYDGTIYGSAWLMARWAADVYASSEPAFFKALVQQTTTYGVSNLEARTGQPWSKLLGQWALSLAGDHYSGVPNAPGFLSWNTRDVFWGMSEALQGFTEDYPLYMPQYKSASFSVPGHVATGSAAFYDLVFYAKQSINLRATATTDLPSNTTIRLALVRME